MKILIVDTDAFIRDELRRALTRLGEFSVETAEGNAAALEWLQKDLFDLVVTDVKMPEMEGIQLLRTIKETRPEMMVILMSGFASVETAVEAMRIGADDYITKPFDLDRLLMHISKVESSRLLLRENQMLRQEVKKKFGFHNIIGKSRKMQEVFSLVEKVARGTSTVMIYGESGTGKELVAKAIHFNSPRAEHPFLPFNCGAIPETLVESELFGHRKGAFTGASQTRKGLFEEANGGTLFLDEVSAVSPAAQVKLLRVLQEKEIMRLGSPERIKIDVRVIAASNENLEEKTKRGDFRDDLFYRLHVFPIFLPDLKDRKEDIPLLVSHFLDLYARESQKEIKGISRETLAILLEYNWPGNVRELENVIERAVIMCDRNYLNPDDLPHNVQDGFSDVVAQGVRSRKSLDEIKEAYIKEILKNCEGNKKAAAEILKVSPKTLYRLSKKEALL
jgi:DNA-binding NtrC family response regulator